MFKSKLPKMVWPVALWLICLLPAQVLAQTTTTPAKQEPATNVIWYTQSSKPGLQQDLVAASQASLPSMASLRLKTLNQVYTKPWPNINLSGNEYNTRAYRTSLLRQPVGPYFEPRWHGVMPGQRVQYESIEFRLFENGKLFGGNR